MKYLYALLVFVPFAIAARLLHASPLLIFLLSAAAIVPLSGILGRATEELAGHTGPTVGGLINATLGNFAELVIGAFALSAGLVDLVKASITGSILGNLLLVLGAAQLAGGLRYKSQKINRNLTDMSSTLLVVAVLGLVMPAVFHALHPDPLRRATLSMSVWVAGLLIVGYAMSLVYSVISHRTIFSEGGDVAHHQAPSSWSLRKAVTVLIAVGATIGVLSELLVGSTEEAVKSLGLSQLFVGLILIPIIGNAAEHSSAVLMALKNRMDLAVSISVGSAIQVALLVGPLLVLLGLVTGKPMDLAFTVMEVASVAVAVAVASSVMQDSESNWLEGAFLLVAYAVIGVAFFYY
ncbi:MAG: calcium/proton exchanger [Gemmatimonadaceae bacterium]|nr:calcium/proton exchanger [Gemmatimonadaceae bacterium]